MNKKNIVLIGMPASGKSTVGVILAKEMKYRFVDTDLILQEDTDQTLVEIIEERGLSGFLSLENETLKHLVTKKRSIISTGGSAIYGHDGMMHLREDGVIIYLKHRFEVIDSRLNNIATRGVAMKDGQTLYDLFVERTPLYEKYADLTIEADGLTTEQTVQVIKRALKNYGKEM